MSNQITAVPLYDMLQQLKTETSKGLRVCLPGSISGIDLSTGTVSVKIGVMQKVAEPGVPSGIAVPYPELTMCPVFSLQGGGVGCIMPIKIGDECLIIFADRCIDNWFSTGQPMPLPSVRMHDIADGFVLVGLNSLAKPLNSSLNTGEGGLCETNNGFGVSVALDPLTHQVAIRNATQSLLTILNLLITTLTALNVGIAAESGIIPTAAAAATAANASLVTITLDLAALLKV